MSARFYLAGDYLPEQTQLPEAIAHHAVTVLRLRVGERFTVFNGDGREQSVAIEAIHKKAVQVSCKPPDAVAPVTGKPLHLVMAVIAQMDWALQKATELGVCQITPFMAARSQGMNAEALARKHSHWQGVVVAACEQSGRRYLPTLNPVVKFADCLKNLEPRHTALADPMAELSLAASAGEHDLTTVLIGPEGGFTGEERELARHAGVIAVQLTPTVLRAETAALAALAYLTLHHV
jgi:16S rRNA (uracil1498-N3)-methyltransferase